MHVMRQSPVENFIHVTIKLTVAISSDLESTTVVFTRLCINVKLNHINKIYL